MGFHVLAWVLVLIVLGGWSLLCWAGHAILTWGGWSQGLDWTQSVGQIELPGWMVSVFGLEWVTWLQKLLLDFGPTLHGWVSGLPDVSGWIGGVVWLVWGVGSLVLVFLGMVASGLIAIARRAAASPSPVIA